MKNTKTINMTGYTVEYVDLRQSKPRTVNKETVVLDADTIRAAGIVGVEITDHIKRYFETGGYSVISVTKGDKREAVVDLKELYRGAVGD